MHKPLLLALSLLGGTAHFSCTASPVALLSWSAGSTGRILGYSVVGLVGGGIGGICIGAVYGSCIGGMAGGMTAGFRRGPVLFGATAGGVLQGSISCIDGARWGMRLGLLYALYSSYKAFPY